LPAGEAHDDAYLGATEVYRGTLAIAVPLPDAGPALLEVKSQGCADAGLCYPPRTRVFAVDPAAGSVTERRYQIQGWNEGSLMPLAGLSKQNGTVMLRENGVALEAHRASRPAF